MRVLLVGPQWVGRWTEGTQKAFANLGHSVQVFYYNSLRVEQVSLGLGRRVERASPWFADQLARYQTQWEQVMNQRLRRLAFASNPDLILVLKGEMLTPETISSLHRAAKYRTVTWWLDDPLRCAGAKAVLPLYDAVFVFDKFCSSSLSQAGVSQSYFLPCCSDADMFHPVRLDRRDKIRYGCDVSFIGVYYANRGKIVEQLTNLRIGIWGPQWDSAEAQQTLARIGGKSFRGRFASQRTAVKIHNASKICLNVHHPQTRDTGLNMRTFEVLACGAFLLSDYVPGIENLFVLGEEVACYSTPEDVRARVEYYLDHPEEQVNIGKRGRARVLREHTYHHRMKSLLAALHLTDQ